MRRILPAYALAIVSAVFSLFDFAVADGQDSTYDLPHLSATASINVTSGQQQVSSTELIKYVITDTEVTVQLTKFQNNQWVTNTIATATCGECYPDGYRSPRFDNNAFLTRDYIALNLYDGIEKKSFFLLAGRASTDNWVQKIVPIEDRAYPSIRKMHNGVLLSSVTGSNRSELSAWRFINDTWMLVDNSFFPDGVLGVYIEHFLEGASDDFIISNRVSGNLTNYRKDAGGEWEVLKIQPLGNISQDRISQVTLRQNTLLVHSVAEDMDLPNRGAMHIFTRANNQWRLEATIIDSEKDLDNIHSQSTSGFLLDPATVLVQHQVNLRSTVQAWEPTAAQNIIYERMEDGNWIPTANINSWSAIVEPFVGEGFLSWEDQNNNMNIRSWQSTPTCSALDSQPPDSNTSACETVTTDLSLSFYANIKPLNDVENSQLQQNNSRSRQSIRFVSVVTNGQAEQHLNLFEYNPTTGSLDKKQISDCMHLNSSNQPCEIISAIVEEDTAFVTLQGSNKLVQLLEDSNGNWNAQQLEVPHTGHGGPVGLYATSIQGDITTVYATSSHEQEYQYRDMVHLLKRNQNSWQFDNFIALSPLRIYPGSYDTYDITHYANRFTISDHNSKVHLFFDNDEEHIRYETTIKPDNSPYAGYRQHALREDTLIVGGPYYAGTINSTEAGDGNSLSFGDKPGIAKIYQRIANEWRETQTLNGIENSDIHFGQQVFIDSDFAVVMAMRKSTPHAVTKNRWYDPTYFVYRRDQDSNYALVKRIDHKPGTEFYCLDCEFSQQIRWPAHLLDGYLFLPVIDGSNINGTTGEHELANYNYSVHDLNETQLPAAGNTDSDNGIVLADENDSGLSENESSNNPVLNNTENNASIANTDATAEEPGGGGAITLFLLIILQIFKNASRLLAAPKEGHLFSQNKVNASIRYHHRRRIGVTGS